VLSGGLPAGRSRAPRPSERRRTFFGDPHERSELQLCSEEGALAGHTKQRVLEALSHLGMTSCSSDCLDHKSIDTEARESEHQEQKDW
jgi:hypothetical protein